MRVGGRPGTELHTLLAGLGIEMPEECQCKARMQQMDAWGAGECRVRRSEIVDWLKESQREAGWLATWQAAKVAVRESWFRVVDPLGSIVDEAIKRAEVKSLGSN